MVACDKIFIARQDFQYSVNNVLSSALDAVTPKKHGVIPPRFTVALFYDHNVAPLAYQRHHAYTYVGVDELAVLLEFALKR